MNITAVKYLSVLLCAVPALPSAAATVYIMALETGRTEAADGNAAEIWETGVMDAFFEAGHIVSNAPSLRISRADDVEFEEAAKKELEDAAAGGADYLVVILLEYENGAETLEPGEISLRLYKIRPRGLLYSEKYTNKPVSAEGMPSPGSLARTLVSYIRGG